MLYKISLKTKQMHGKMTSYSVFQYDMKMNFLHSLFCLVFQYKYQDTFSSEAKLPRIAAKFKHKTSKNICQWGKK